jgi:hypothetical protein
MVSIMLRPLYPGKDPVPIFMAETLGKVLGNKMRGVAACQEQVGKHFSTSCEQWALCDRSIFF